MLSNSGSAQIGDAQTAGLDTLTAGGLDNSGTMTLIGYRGSSYNASLIVTGVANEGALALSSEAQASIGNSLVNTGSITLDASSSSGGAALTVSGPLVNTETVTIGNTANTGLGGSDRLTLGSLSNYQGATITLMGSAPLTTTMSVKGAAADNGSIVATNSKLVMTGAVTGTGTIALKGGDELELGGADWPRSR